MTTKRVKIVREKTNDENVKNIFMLYEIDVDQGKDIIRFLKSNTDLIPVLIEAWPQIKNIFGEVKVRLELERDPNEGWEELFGMIKVKDNSEDALYLRNKLGQEWFLPSYSNLIGRLNFGIE